jgi:hypothetical protein
LVALAVRPRIRRMSDFDAYTADDMKLIYRVLHANLLENLQLMDSDFFSELQAWLQALAKLEGVDVSDHGQWDRWLNQAHVPCAERLAQRRVLHA